MKIGSIKVHVSRSRSMARDERVMQRKQAAAVRARDLDRYLTAAAAEIMAEQGIDVADLSGEQRAELRAIVERTVRGALGS